MKHVYIPVMYGEERVGSAYIDADRLVVTISDRGIKDQLWGDHLTTNVSIELPGNDNLTITYKKEGNTNG